MSEQSKEIVSTPRIWRLTQLSIHSFRKIEKAKTLVIMIPDGKRIVKFTGDAKTGKSSSLWAVACAAGLPLAENCINLVDKQAMVDLNIEEVKDGSVYTATASRKPGGNPAYTLSIKEKGDDFKPNKLNSPKERMERLVGNVSINPTNLQNMKGKEQIEWLRTLTSFSADQKKLETKILTDIKTTTEQRTEVGRTIKTAKTLLIDSGFYLYDDENKALITTPALGEALDKINNSTTNQDELKDKFAQAEKAKDAFEKAETAVSEMKNKIPLINAEIERLEKLLQQERDKLETTNKRIADGQAYIEANKLARQTFTIMQQEVLNYGQIELLQQKISQSDAKIKEYNEYTEMWTQFTGAIDKLENNHRELVQQSTPNIPGLEVVVASGIDNPRAEGLYYNGMPIAMLSESELWALHVQLLELQNTGIVIIENITSLGTDAINTLNWFANEKGGYVFCSQMERGQDSLKVEFHTTL